MSQQHGTFDWRVLVSTVTEHDRLANQHRPTELAQLGREVRRLRADGLTDRDIADALRLDLATVRQCLQVAE